MTDTDLTTLTTPFGLLDKETQDALKAHELSQLQFFDINGGWRELLSDQEILASLTYRVKPQPPKPREFWAVPFTDGSPANGAYYQCCKEAQQRGGKRVVKRFIEWPEGAPLPDMPEVKNG